MVVSLHHSRERDLDAGTRSDGLTSDERDESARLRRENRRLREDATSLKRATAFFAKETWPHWRRGPDTTMHYRG